MTRHAIYAGWSLDIPQRFTRRMTDDGFVVFECERGAIWCVVYEVSGVTPTDVLVSYLSDDYDDGCIVEFLDSKCELVGYIRSSETRNDSLCLSTLVAASGRIVSIDFEFQRPDGINLALGIWRSIRFEE